MAHYVLVVCISFFVLFLSCTCELCRFSLPNGSSTLYMYLSVSVFVSLALFLGNNILSDLPLSLPIFFYFQRGSVCRITYIYIYIYVCVCMCVCLCVCVCV